MSKMIPQSVVNTLRSFVDVSVDLFGIPCVLNVVKYPDEIDYNDINSPPADYVYNSYTTQVWIAWSSNKYKLRKLGLYLEDDTPMIAWFANKLQVGVEGESSSSIDDVDIVIGSYFKIEAQYVPDKIAAEEFEVVDILVPEMHDAVITKCYKIAPRRVKRTELK